MRCLSRRKLYRKARHDVGMPTVPVKGYNSFKDCFVGLLIYLFGLVTVVLEDNTNIVDLHAVIITFHWPLMMY